MYAAHVENGRPAKGVGGGGWKCPAVTVVAPCGPHASNGLPPKGAVSRAGQHKCPAVQVVGSCSAPTGDACHPKNHKIMGLGDEVFLYGGGWGLLGAGGDRPSANGASSWAMGA